MIFETLWEGWADDFAVPCIVAFAPNRKTAFERFRETFELASWQGTHEYKDVVWARRNWRLLRVGIGRTEIRLSCFGTGVNCSRKLGRPHVRFYREPAHKYDVGISDHL